jgi:SAM-dependent methyltransferase
MADMPDEPCWTTGEMPNPVAALPRGRAGRLGGTVMRITNGAEQREVAGLLAPLVTRGSDVVEIGCGPGSLLAILARGPAGTVRGVDPSEEMRTMAVRALAQPIAGGRVRVAAGSAAATGLPGGSADVLVSVNTVAIWPDLDAGADELHRVLRPDGTLVLSWHGGTAPSRAARRLCLPSGQLDRIEQTLSVRFADVRQDRTRRCTVFTARRPA